MNSRSSYFLLASLALCAAPARAESVIVERIVAVVNSEIVLLSDVKERAAQAGHPIDDSGTNEQRRHVEQELRPLLDHMVDELLITQQAAELKLAVDESEVDRAV